MVVYFFTSDDLPYGDHLPNQPKGGLAVAPDAVQFRGSFHLLFRGANFHIR